MAGPDAAAGEATKSIELGFRCVKFKVGYSHVGQDRAAIRLGENLWGPHDLTKCLAAGGLGFYDAGRHEDWRDYGMAAHG